MSGIFYQRYVPPKPATKKITPTANSSPIAPPKQSADSLGHVKQKKKSERRSSVDLAAAAVESPKAEESHELVDENVDESVGTPKSLKKPKKRKREAQDDARAEAQEEAIPKKHKSILSKFERSSKRAEAVRSAAVNGPQEEQQEEKPVEELHDLEPLPQPTPVPEAPFEPTFSSLPKWLAKPITVESSKTVPFTELGVQDAFLKKLDKQGFKDALAVQSVLLPMLHPGYEQHMGDICVSARTGSGKTLAYLLPIVEALKDQVVTTLSAIVVVPTRQLVDQALKVAEELCTGTKLKVGTALGNVPFVTEQKQLVKLRAHYDSVWAKKLHQKASQQLSDGIFQRGGIFNDLAIMPANHVPQYDSGVDILICTPGRLVEHIENTTGFLLRSMKWLVIDEADQLLTQNFQGWATVLMDALHSDTPEDFMSLHERLRKRREGSTLSIALQTNKHVTKVVLSATMKKDLTKLGMLRLTRPKLVVVEDEKEEPPLATDNDVFELPLTLDEFAIPVGDGSNKPLYLLYHLLRHIFAHETPFIPNGEKTSKKPGSASDSNSSSDSDTDSSSDSDSDSDSDSNSDVRTAKQQPHALKVHKNRVLIFAKSNENASRLSHLLTYLEPSLTPYLTTMTPSLTAKQTAKLLRDFSTGKTKILIASDAASRGLDIPSITHVINYDIPSSVVSYVHRVGRTARAGKAGQAWTLFTKSEAGWYWNAIARGESVRRGTKAVKRIEFKERNVTWDRKRTYQEALKSLQGAVEGNVDVGV